MLRTTTGKVVSWDSHPSEDRSEPPQRKGTEVSLYPTSPSWRSAVTTCPWKPLRCWACPALCGARWQAFGQRKRRRCKQLTHTDGYSKPQDILWNWQMGYL